MTKQKIDFFDGKDHVLKQLETHCLHCGGRPTEAAILWNTQTQLIRHVDCESDLKQAGVFSYIPAQFYDGEDERMLV